MESVLKNLKASFRTKSFEIAASADKQIDAKLQIVILPFDHANSTAFTRNFEYQ